MGQFKPAPVVADIIEKSLDDHINWLVAHVKNVGEERSIALTEEGSSLRRELGSLRDCGDIADEELVIKLAYGWTRFIHDVMILRAHPHIENDFEDTETEVVVEMLKVYESTLRIFAEEKRQSLLELLGKDFADLMLWSRGELSYMFTSCRMKMNECLDDEEVKIAKLGVEELTAMLRRPQNVDVETEYDAQGEGGKEAMGLIKLGILSDSHLLATMYAGEMSYWVWVREGKPTVVMTSSEMSCSDSQCDTKLPANFWCSRCKVARYCSRDCQKRHWKAGGHKQNCGTTTDDAQSDAKPLEPVAPGDDNAASAASLATGNATSTDCGKQAVRFLQKYVTAISGNGQLQRAWSTERAKELLSELVA